MDVAGGGHALPALREAPAFGIEFGLHDGDGDGMLEALQLAGGQSARGPGADERDIEMIAAGLGLETALARGSGAAVGRYPVAERRFLADEGALGVLGLD